jgi:uncharacterized protein (DUF305 family)
MVHHSLSRLAAPFALALAATPALAQGNQPMQGHPGMMQGQGMGMMQQNMPQDPASRAYTDSMRKMNQGMMGKPMSGDADRDFATMMMSHHQGAIDMARVELEHGKDPELKAMAQKVIGDQSREVKELQDWLDRHPAQAARK